jgi:hypothetical protein
MAGNAWNKLKAVAPRLGRTNGRQSQHFFTYIYSMPNSPLLTYTDKRMTKTALLSNLDNDNENHNAETRPQISDVLV